MSTNIVYEPGYKIAVACTYPAAPVTNNPVRYAYRTGIAETSEDSVTGLTSVNFGAFDAEFSVAETAGTGITAGDVIWFHDAAASLNNTSAGGYFYGYAMAAIGAGLTATIRVHHEPSPGAGTIADGAVGTTQLATTSVTVPILSTAANTRPVIIPLGAVSATTSQIAFVAPRAGVINSVKLVTKDAVAADDTNYWTFTLTDKGTGAGIGKIVEKTTKITGGSALVAYVALSLGTPDATHKIMALGDVVLFTATKAASATALAEAALLIEFLPTEA